MSCKNGFSLYNDSLFNNTSQSVPSNWDVKYGSKTEDIVGPTSSVDEVINIDAIDPLPSPPSTLTKGPPATGKTLADAPKNKVSPAWALPDIDTSLANRIELGTYPEIPIHVKATGFYVTSSAEVFVDLYKADSFYTPSSIVKLTTRALNFDCLVFILLFLF